MKSIVISFLLLCMTQTLMSLDTELIEQKIYLKVNEQRKKNGLAPYQYNLKLEKLARYHTENMIQHDFFSHTDQDGYNPGQRALNLIPELIGGIGENIAYNYGSSEEEAASKLMTAWMNSPGHRANILSKKYNYIGIGVYLSGDRVYSTQNFGDLIAELISISDTEFQYESTLKMRFKYLSDFDHSLLNIFISFPEKNAKYYLENGVYYTGMGKYVPQWIDSDTFEIDVHLKYGRGRYQLKMGKSPYLYNAFDFKVK